VYSVWYVSPFSVRVTKLAIENWNGMEVTVAMSIDEAAASVEVPSESNAAHL
jgi:hypothetical protein